MGSVDARHMPNPITEDTVVLPISPEDAWEVAASLLRNIELKRQTAGITDRNLMEKSSGKLSKDVTVYTGVAGLALTYLRFGHYCLNQRRDNEEAREYFSKALQAASQSVQPKPKSMTEAHERQVCVSFFCGSPGALAIAAASAYALESEDVAVGHIAALVAWADIALEHPYCELLFGQAGFLYALLWVRSMVREALCAEFDPVLQQVAERVVSWGKTVAEQPPYQNSGWELMWECFEEPYMGAAHGHVGILAMLFYCFDLLCESSQTSVVRTLDQLLRARFESGNLPIILNDQRDQHVHWCHGAPGMISMLCVASRALPARREELLCAAAKACDVVWDRGLILKGLGLCHGIAGNAYSFLTLFNATNDVKYLQMVHAFAMMMKDPAMLEMIAKQPDSQRAVLGQPDSLFSLMEGEAGVACFWLDMARPEGALFPGWEL